MNFVLNMIAGKPALTGHLYDKKDLIMQLQNRIISKDYFFVYSDIVMNEIVGIATDISITEELSIGGRIIFNVEPNLPQHQTVLNDACMAKITLGLLVETSIKECIISGLFLDRGEALRSAKMDCNIRAQWIGTLKTLAMVGPLEKSIDALAQNTGADKAMLMKIAKEEGLL